MKSLKSADIPDLIKTVKSKKLPVQALKTITSRFQIVDGKISLKKSAEELKEEAKTIFDEYVNTN